jgi:hypothetical protein
LPQGALLEIIQRRQRYTKGASDFNQKPNFSITGEEGKKRITITMT